MNREDFRELSLTQLGALVERWERDDDAGAPVLRAYLEAAEAVGADIEVNELARSGVSARHSEKHPLVERYRLAVEASRFDIGEGSPLGVTWTRGVAGRLNVTVLDERCALADVARVLGLPSARFVEDVVFQARVGPSDLSGLDAAVESLRDRLVTPRIWTDDDTARAWLEVLGDLPRIRCRIADNDPTHQFFWTLLQRGKVPKEMHFDLVKLETTGQRSLDLDEEESAQALIANVSCIAEYADRGTRVSISATDLEVNQATGLLDVMPNAFGDGAGILTRHANLDGYTTLTTAAPRTTSGHSERLVFTSTDEVELRDRKGTRLWSSSESPTITRGDTTYEWLERDVSKRLRRSSRRA